MTEGQTTPSESALPDEASARAVLRAEASVLSKLTEEQRDAADRAYALLEAMLQSKDQVDEPKPSYLPRIDPERSNRVLLLDGRRGSGKTALLVTMLDALRRAHMQEPGARRTKSAAATNPAAHSWPNPDPRIVPVGLLDLHPLPPSTNLLFYVIGRFERVLEWIEGDGKNEREPGAWHFAERDALPSRKKWQSLLRAAAAGWDGNVKERGARLDLEAYAAELEEAERQRLNVIDTFADFFGALVDDFVKRKQGLHKASPPLFVLAVDDADMNPRRSIELLETVRMLWHPRLAFVLTGDTNLFRQTLAEHYLAEVRSPLRHHGLVDREVARLTEGREFMRLANDVYDKIIPPGHRCEIPPIPPERRRMVATLGSALAAIPVKKGSASPAESLDWYFDEEPQLADALPDRIRGIIDLANLARTRRTSPPSLYGAPASRLVEDIWSQVVNTSQRALGPYKGFVSVNPGTGALDIRDTVADFHLDFNTLLAAQSSPDRGRPLVSFLQIDRIDAVLPSGEILDRPVVAALMLAADVAFDQDRGTWNGPVTRISGYEGYFANSEYQLPGASSLTYLAWPLPNGYSLPFYAAFSWRWRRALKEQADRTVLDEANPAVVDADAMAQRFLQAVLDVLWAKATTRREPVERSWKSLARRVVELMHKGGTRTRAWALQRAAMLAAPEYGLSEMAANAWLFALHEAAPPARWKEMCERLPAERQARLEAAGVMESRKAASRIDEAFPGHRWGPIVELHLPFLPPDVKPLRRVPRARSPKP